MSHQHLIYQVDLFIDAEVAASFDAWLARHVDEMLAISGFISAEILADTEGPNDGVVKRTVQYRVSSREALDHYLAHDAERMRGEGQRMFGGYFKATRKIFAAGGQKTADPDLQLLRVCKNCSAPLTGQYCHQCGQRDRARLITVWELFRDLIGDLFELDSRIWRSVRPLLFRPGKLTREYLAGRQVHYTPPLRMYLVVSILFFVIANFSSDNFKVSIDGTNLPTEATAEQRGDPDQCDDININLGWEPLERPETVQLIKERCRRIVAAGSRAFLQRMGDNLPTMIFLFLPLIALVQKILYVGSRRYYVEHLLFFVHFHSFFFLALTIAVLLGRLASVSPVPGWTTTLAIVGISFYIPVYLFKAMRSVYGQGFVVTLIKYLLLFVAYIFCLALTMTVGLLYTVLTS